MFSSFLRPPFVFPSCSILYNSPWKEVGEILRKRISRKLEKRQLAMFLLLLDCNFGVGHRAGSALRLSPESQPARLTGCLLDWQEGLSTALLPPRPCIPLQLLLSPCPVLAPAECVSVSTCSSRSLQSSWGCEVRVFRAHLHLFSVAALITHNKGI